MSQSTCKHCGRPLGKIPGWDVGTCEEYYHKCQEAWAAHRLSFATLEGWKVNAGKCCGKAWPPFEELKDYDSPLGPLFNSNKMTVYANGIYIVVKRVLEDGCVWLSIRSEDNTATHDWRHLQKIKNELVGPEIEAIEIYPAESRLVDTSNQYHLWCMPPGTKLGFGFGERLVTEAEIETTKQRRFESAVKPTDLLSEDDMRERLKAKRFTGDLV